MSMILACALLLQTDSAEESFKKIEHTLLKANTLKVRFRFVMDEKREETTLRREGPVTMLFKNGTMFYVRVKYPGGGDDEEMVIVAKGEKGAWRKDGEWQPTRWIVPKGADRRFRLTLARGGLAGPMAPSPFPWFLGAQSKDFEKTWKVSGVRYGTEGNKIKSLIYNLKWGKHPPIKVQLWYDSTSFTLIKREYEFNVPPSEDPSLTFAASQGTYTETYSEFVLNADIPDEKFKLPAEKK